MDPVRVASRPTPSTSWASSSSPRSRTCPASRARSRAPSSTSDHRLKVTRAAHRRVLFAAAGLLVLGVAGAVMYAVWPRGVWTRSASTSTVSTGWPSRCRTGFASRRSDATRRSRCWCRTRTSQNPCCCPLPTRSRGSADQRPQLLLTGTGGRTGEDSSHEASSLWKRWVDRARALRPTIGRMSDIRRWSGERIALAGLLATLAGGGTSALHDLLCPGPATRGYRGEP